jgi:hypothetical protein
VPRPPLTYDEIVAALRLADRLGDCVPEDIEGTAHAIVAHQAPPLLHVVVSLDGVFVDPCVVRP